MALNSFTSGVNTSFSTQLNDNFKNSYPRIVASTPYTGTGFDAYRDGTTGTTTNNTTLTVAANLVYDYIRIVMTLYVGHSGTSVVNYGSASLKIETSVASAASWTTRFDQAVAQSENTGITTSSFGTQTIEFYYAPTSGEKSSGLDIKITGSAVTTYASGTAQGRISNIQTTVFAN